MMESKEFNVEFNDGDTFECTFKDDEPMDVDFGGTIEKEYHGIYHVTPSESEQVLDTTNKLLTDNVVIDPIPSNYGLVTWDGSILMIS